MAKNKKTQEKIILPDENNDKDGGLSIKNFERLEREINIQLKKLDLDEQKLTLKEKEFQLEEIQRKEIINDEKRISLDMIDTLQNLLTSHIVDTDRTIMGSEPVLIPVYDEIERGLLKKKIFDILKTF